MTETITGVPMLDLKAQWQTIAGEVLPLVEEVFSTQACIFGPLHDRFEQDMAAYCKVKHALAVSSGTDALLVSLLARGIGPGDEVICPPFTFFATAGCIARTGAKPVFVDICPTCYNIEPEKIQAAINPRTKAIMPVHLFGQMADMSRIQPLVEANRLALIEDAAQAVGAMHQGKPVGHWGGCAALSFYPTKNLGAAGEGGMVLTNDDKLAGRIRQLRNHGQTGEYEHAHIGGNFRLAALQCAVLGVKLKHLPAWTARRQAAAQRYDQLLAGLPLHTPRYYPFNNAVVHQYTIRVPGGRRDALKQALAEAKVGCKVFYPLPLHLQPCFAYLGYKKGDFPQAELAAHEVLSLPMFSEITEVQQQYVADAIRSFFKDRTK